MAEDQTARAVGIDVIKGAVAGFVAAAPTGDPKAMAVGTAFGALGGGGAEMMQRAIASFRTGNDAGFREAHGELAARAVESEKEQIHEKIKVLEQKIGADAAASAVPPVTKAWAETWARAEGKKQRILMAALVSAFDPESYEAAMSCRFFAILDELDYPEVQHLMKLPDQEQAGPSGPRVVFRSAKPLDEGSTHRARLAAQGLLRVTSESEVTVTWLGGALVEFLKRGGYSGEDPRAEKPTATDGKE